MDNIVDFPIKKPSTGLIKNQQMNVRCKACGNTKKFYGKAITQPFIIVEQSDHHDYKYDVTEVGYSQKAYVDEVIETCAECGSNDIDIQILQKDSI